MDSGFDISDLHGAIVYTDVRNPISPHYDSMEASEDVTLDLALATEGFGGGLKALLTAITAKKGTGGRYRADRCSISQKVG